MKQKPRIVRLGNMAIGEGQPLVWIAGPCVVENEKSALRHARYLKKIARRAGIPLIYKSSYDKANRSSAGSFRGLGIDAGLSVLDHVKRDTGLAVLTDVHTAEEAKRAAEIVDILQIPAFLCRQTDLLTAAGRTGKIVNVKKGQFVAPWDMGYAAEKVSSTGNLNVMLTERGTCFGYNALVSDFRSIPIMKKFGFPVIFDATHSVQQPGGLGKSSGGQREFAPVLAQAAVAVGADGIFTEVHEDPDRAPSDGPNMIPLNQVEAMLELLLKLSRVMRARRAA